MGKWLLKGTPAGVFYADDGDGCCFVCMDKKMTKCRAIQPCKHAGVCRGCIKQIPDNKCPSCRGEITGLGKPFAPTPTPTGEVEDDEAKYNDQHHHGAVKKLKMPAGLTAGEVEDYK